MVWGEVRLEADGGTWSFFCQKERKRDTSEASRDERGHSESCPFASSEAQEELLGATMQLRHRTHLPITANSGYFGGGHSSCVTQLRRYVAVLTWGGERTIWVVNGPLRG